jgi:hypothetical protein
VTFRQLRSALRALRDQGFDDDLLVVVRNEDGTASPVSKVGTHRYHPTSETHGMLDEDSGPHVPCLLLRRAD